MRDDSQLTSGTPQYGVDNTTADDDAAIQSYRFAAAVLSNFDSGSLKPLEPRFASDSGAVLDLLDECERVWTEKEEWRWMLKNSIRREALAKLGTREAIHRVLYVNARPDDVLQRIFEGYITEHAPPVGQQTVAELTATVQVRDWLEGIVTGLPDRELLNNSLQWQQLLQPFRHLVGNYFRGRTRELAALREYIGHVIPIRSIYQARPLMIYGPGGVGKSTLLAKFILEQVDQRQSRDFAFCYWDFDRATLLPEEPLTLLAELVLQLSLQFPGMKAPAQAIRQQWLNELAESVGTGHGVQTKSGERGAQIYRDLIERSVLEALPVNRYIDEFEYLISEVPEVRDTRLLLVLDTFERVQEVSFEFSLALWDFLNDLQRIFPRLRVIVAGRAELSSELAHSPFPLSELDEEAAKGYLASRGVTNRQLQDAVFAKVGGDPMSLHLAADTLRQEHKDLSSLDTLPTDFDQLGLDHELNQSWLYRRYLDRIGDPDIRSLAYPGLTLRVVTPELIREVLAIPCKVKVDSDEVARQLFEKLASQVSLVTRQQSNLLRHRQDVRKRMLRALVQTDGVTVFEINRRAVEYYSRQPPTVTARAEEVYHRLFIARSRDDIDPLWMTGIAPLLRDAVEEVPPEMRSYLISKLEGTSATFDWNEADALTKEDFVATRAQDAMTVNRLTDSLQILSEVRDRLPGSKLYRLEAQTLDRLGRYAEALIVANEGIFSARRARDTDLELDLLLIAVRANEVLGQYDRASRLLNEAQQLDVHLKPPQDDLLALELRMHELRLCRLDPAHCSSDITSLRWEAYQQLEPLFELASRQAALMLLDMVEEIGIAEPGVLVRTILSFRSVFEAEMNQPHLARLLRVWAGALASKTLQPGGTLTSIARLLEAGKRDEVMKVVELTQPFTWPDLFDHLLKTYPPKQVLVTGLVDLVRTTLASNQPMSTSLSTLVAQITAALHSAFSTRSELMNFLYGFFPEEALSVGAASSYTELVTTVATTFERKGLTEELIDKAISYSPSNTLLPALRRVLETASRSISPNAPGLESGTLGEPSASGSNSVAISGNVIGATIVTGGHVVITGNAVGSTFVRHESSIPPEILATLPKSFPPFTPKVIQEPALAAPAFVVNWAHGLWQAMRTVCRVEGAEAVATGFLVAPDLILCALGRELSNLIVEKETRFRFDHCHLPNGSLSNSIVYVTAEDWLVATNKKLGYTLVRLQGTPGFDLVPGEDFQRGWLTLSAAPLVADQDLFMLHHALGGPQMLQYATVKKSKAGGARLAAVSGAGMPGAAGAPCCNEAWQVSAIRIGTDQPGARQAARQRAAIPAIRAQDLLEDPDFRDALKRHLLEGGYDLGEESPRPV